MTLDQEKILRYLISASTKTETPLPIEEARELVIGATSQQIANAAFAIDHSLLLATVKKCLCDL